MKVLLVVALLVCVACVFADDKPEDHQKCLPLQKIKVRRQWAQAYGEGKHRIEFAQHFYRKLFKEFPKARDMYSKFRSDNIYSPEFVAFTQRLFETLTMIIDTMDDPEANKVIVAKLKVTLAERGVKPEFHSAFRDELMETIPEFLETHFDWDAWMGCLNALINALH